MRRKLMLLALTAGMLALSPTADANIFHPDNWTCRASALRANALGGLVFSEPVVANRRNDPCVDENAAAATANVPNLVAATVLSASTDNEARGASSRASAADVLITLGSTSIYATVLSARASASCGVFHPNFAGSSSIATLAVNGKAYAVDGPTTINIPTSGGLVSIAANEQVRTSDSITQRALRVSLLPFSGLATTVVVGEAIADVNGNPCA